MKKILIAIAVIVILAVAYWLGSPLFINKTVEESAPVQEGEESVAEIASGQFSGFDAIHTGSGTAKLLQVDDSYYIRFEEDFHVNNGPDLYVGFGKDGKYVKGSEIGALEGNIGSQNYLLPDGFDSSQYNEVWIWCKAFSVPFAKAPLQ